MAKVTRGRSRISSLAPTETRKPDAMSMARKTTRTRYEAREIATTPPSKKSQQAGNKRGLDAIQSKMKPIRSGQ